MFQIIRRDWESVSQCNLQGWNVFSAYLAKYDRTIRLPSKASTEVQGELWPILGGPWQQPSRQEKRAFSCFLVRTCLWEAQCAVIEWNDKRVHTVSARWGVGKPPRLCSLFKYLFNFMYVNVLPEYVCQPHTCLLSEVRRNHQILFELDLGDGCHVSCRCWEPYPSPLQEQLVFLTMEPYISQAP